MNKSEKRKKRYELVTKFIEDWMSIAEPLDNMTDMDHMMRCYMGGLCTWFNEKGNPGKTAMKKSIKLLQKRIKSGLI